MKIRSCRLLSSNQRDCSNTASHSGDVARNTVYTESEAHIRGLAPIKLVREARRRSRQGLLGTG